MHRQVRKMHRNGRWNATGTVVYTGTLKMRDMKLRDMKMRHHVAGVENARHENARNVIVWNTACCICLSIAEQECMSRQERAPDFAANCVLLNDQHPVSN